MVVTSNIFYLAVDQKNKGPHFLGLHFPFLPNLTDFCLVLGFYGRSFLDLVAATMKRLSPQKRRESIVRGSPETGAEELWRRFGLGLLWDALRWLWGFGVYFFNGGFHGLSWGFWLLSVVPWVFSHGFENPQLVIVVKSGHMCDFIEQHFSQLSHSNRNALPSAPRDQSRKNDKTKVLQ